MGARGSLGAVADAGADAGGGGSRVPITTQAPGIRQPLHVHRVVSPLCQPREVGAIREQKEQIR